MAISEAFFLRRNKTILPWLTLRHSLALGVAVIFAFLPVVALAQGLDTGLTNFSNNSGLSAGSGDLKILIARIIRALLGFLGLLAIGVVLYGGYLWMTSAGNSERIELAQKVLRNGAIGLVIILISFSIVSFLLNWLVGTGGNTNNGSGSPPPCSNCFALGNGIIEDHYPGRDQKNVPRNTSMAITFREPILVIHKDPKTAADIASLPKSFLSNAVSKGEDFGTVTCSVLWCGTMNENVFDLAWDPGDGTGYKQFSSFDVYTNDEKVFVFILHGAALLGLPDVNTKHRATVHTTLTKKNGDSGFLVQDSKYAWSFEVSTIIDTTPPKIIDVLPWEYDELARNTVVQVTFNEAVNPISASGSTADGFNNLIVANADNGNTPVNGTFSIGNGYRTVEFVSSDPCGTNSCNQTIYCLPASVTVSADVKAAMLWSDPGCNLGPEPSNNPSRACTPSPGNGIFDGVVDMASNSLDGSKNIEKDSNGNPVLDSEGHQQLRMPSGDGTADGPPKDSFSWSFKTTDTIVSSGPEIINVTPEVNKEGVNPKTPIVARFNRRLSIIRTYLDKTNPARPEPHAPIAFYQEDKVGDPYVPYPYAFTTNQQPVHICTLPSLSDPTKVVPCTSTAECLALNNDPANKCEQVCSLTHSAEVGGLMACNLNKDCNGGTLDFCGREDASLNHSGLEDPSLSGSQSHKKYEPRYGSVIHDSYQNCFYPSNGPVNGQSNVPGDVTANAP
ncbi:MAG: hypothetical protein WC817_01160 [Patescibacteria group bacterium]|jgi:hypothetical protein